MRIRSRLLAALLLALAILVDPGLGLAQPGSALDVRVVADQADAALAIIARHAEGEAVDEADWVALFGSEGFRRLEARARSFDRSGSGTSPTWARTCWRWTGSSWTSPRAG